MGVGTISATTIVTESFGWNLVPNTIIYTFKSINQPNSILNSKVGLFYHSTDQNNFYIIVEVSFDMI